MPDALLDRDVSGPVQVLFDLADEIRVRVVVPDGLQGPVPGALDERIRALLVRVLPSEELLLGHVLGIEAGAFGLVSVSRKEGFPVDAVPGAVVDLRVQFLGGIREGPEEGFAVPEILLPVDLVHFVSGHPVQFQDLFPVVGDARQIRGGDGHLGVILHEPARVGLVPGAGNRDQGENRQNS